MNNAFCSYYTESDEITDYMIQMLQLKNGDRVLEPSAGSGVFIKKILTYCPGVHIDALEINPEAVKALQKQFSAQSKNVVIRETDTLFDTQLDSLCADGYYDKIIGNPPYGAWQSLEKRQALKNKYSGYYVKETYTLFLLRCLTALKRGGRLSFIVPDTFMFLNMHEKLRKTLLRESIIEQVLIFPSKFFPGISFGYSNLSIITLRKAQQNEDPFTNVVEIYKGFGCVAELPDVAKGVIPPHVKKVATSQGSIYNNTKSAFFIDVSENPINLSKITQTLGDVADVVTGFYSGDNTRFIMVRDKSVKGSKNYHVIDPRDVTEVADVTGIKESGKTFIPYVKSAAKERYIQHGDDWYIKWDAETILFYQTNKKSRFQNSQYYFKRGIVIPMVKSSTLRASLINNRVFDQALVGVFPKDENMLLYVLAFLNSDIACKMIHIINPTANNSSNYVKLIPFIPPDENERKYIEQLVELLLSSITAGDSIKASELQIALNNHFENKYLPALSIST